MNKDEAVTTASPALESQELDIPDGAAYDHWRKTGELPSDEKEVEKVEEQQRQEEEAVSRERQEESAPPEKKPVKEAESGPAAKPAQQPTGTKRDANSRIRQLAEENRQTREKYERLLEQVAAGKPARDEKGVEAAPPAAKPEASKQPAEPTIEDKDEKGEFKYKTFGDYQKAWQKWMREDTLRQANEAFDQRFTQSQKDRERQAEVDRHRSVFGPRVAKAREKYEDFDAVAFNQDLPIVEGSLIEGFILDSEVGPEIAYYLGQHQDEVMKITGLTMQRNEHGQFLRVHAGMSPNQAARYLAMIEMSLTPDEEEGGGEAVPAKTAKPAAAAAKPVTRAPAPAPRVEGKSPSSKSDEARALEDDDFEAYSHAANNRELAARKTRR